MKTRRVTSRPLTRLDSAGPTRHAVRVPVTSGGDWRRLKQRVRAAMREHGYETQQQLADEMKVSRATVSKIFSGEGVGEATLIALDEALLWEPGSAQGVLDGGEPQPRRDDGEDGTTPTPPPEPRADQGHGGAEFVRQLRRLRERSRDRQAFIDTVLLLVDDPDDML